MKTLLTIGVTDPDEAAWAKWLNDVMTSWPGQLVVLLLYAGLMVLLVRHASREWENGARNTYLVGFLVVSGVFFVLQFLLASSLVGDVGWPAWPFVVEFIVLVALWLYAFVRFMTRQRSGPGDDATRARGAALDRALDAARADDVQAGRPGGAV
jgi:membrane protein implicated in regulation of membrane protease activity